MRNRVTTLVAGLLLAAVPLVAAAPAADAATTSPTTVAVATTTAAAPSRMAQAFTGQYKVSRGITYFHTSTQVHELIGLAPGHKAKLRVALQYYKGGKWRTLQTATFTTGSTGLLGITLKGALPTKTSMRFLVTFSGDSVGRALPTQASGIFQIG